MAKPQSLKPQTIKVTNPSFLKQGSIFNLESVVFDGTPDDKAKYGKDKFTFKDFYPYCEYEVGSAKGIVINQSCDLVFEKSGAVITRPPKVPYISVCLVESLSSIIHLSLKNNKNWAKCVHVDDLVMSGTEKTRVKIVTQDFLKKFSALGDKFKEIINNNHNWAFFIIFEEGDDLIIKGVNLTKTFPVRVDHYQNILSNVTHELETQFENKLGWKIAELYGRVGTRDYSDDEASYLTELIHLDLKASFKGYLDVPDSDFTKLKSRSIKYASDAQTYVDDLMKLYEKKPI